MDKLKVDIYLVLSDACHRAENGDRKWRKDPNHFLIDFAVEILTLCEEAK